MVHVTCPNCSEKFQVVIPDELQGGQTGRESVEERTTTENPSTLTAELMSWDQVEETQDPYSANPEKYETAQQVRADVRINGDTYKYDFWYVPHDENWEYFKYTARAQTDAGQKSLNVYDSSHGLFVKNRAVPWTTNKQWTYLQPEELKRRSKIAGLGEVIDDEEGEGGYGLLINMQEQPLVDVGDLNEEFIVTLAKAHLVMWSRENPAT